MKEQGLSSRIIETPGPISLAAYDPDDTAGMSHQAAEQELARLQERMGTLQELLFGAGEHSVLIVLQGMDTSGKDGAIKHVMSGINPSGCRVWTFKAPTEEEAAHDFLWRVHMKTPPYGMVAILNRSHYEDVLVARVRRLVPRTVWEARYDQINAFERMLTENKTILLKFFLHISKDEQKQRLLAREQDPAKGWKLSVSDWEDREYWDAYQQAYEDVLRRCSTQWAPWYIVPANKKWYRNFFVARAIVERLEQYERDWTKTLDKRSKQERAALRDYRKQMDGQTTTSQK
jgi:PPK2 family polyphosphate:nucleotide phosphotransferase